MLFVFLLPLMLVNKDYQYMGLGKCDFPLKSPFNWDTVRDMVMVAM